MKTNYGRVMDKCIVLVIVATLASYTSGHKVDRGEALCLAKNIYHEARSEPIMDQVRVSAVTIQTAEKRGTTVCEEVYRPYRYSWTLQDKKVDTSNKIEAEAWKQAVDIAVLMLAGDDLGHDVHGATHFYTPSLVYPDWAKGKIEVARGRDFVFMRSP